MRTLILAAALAATVAAAPAAAQSDPVQPGQRVMLVLTRQPEVEGHARWGETLSGTVVEASADSLTLQVHPGTGPIRVARSVVVRTYVSRGVPSRARSAALWAAGGAVSGAIMAWVAPPRDNHLFANKSTGQAALIGAGVGATTGVVFGALYPAERWKRVRMPSNVAVAPAIGSGAHGLAVNIRM
jgi:hypothetical protein